MGEGETRKEKQETGEQRARNVGERDRKCLQAGRELRDKLERQKGKK